MDWYVESCGINPEHGYQWVQVSNGGQVRAEPAILARHEVSKLIYGEKFSIVLGRYDGKIVLFVANLEASREDDYRGRLVRNSIACIGDYHDEVILRGIAVAALRGKLASPVDQAVQFDSDDEELGFRVIPEHIDELCHLSASASQKTNSRNLIAKNNELFRQELANALDNAQLPNREGPLVVVTTFKSPDVLKKEQVWRGLSNLVEADGWQVTAQKSTSSSGRHSSSGKQARTGTRKSSNKTGGRRENVFGNIFGGRDRSSEHGEKLDQIIQSQTAIIAIKTDTEDINHKLDKHLSSQKQMSDRLNEVEQLTTELSDKMDQIIPALYSIHEILEALQNKFDEMSQRRGESEEEQEDAIE